MSKPLTILFDATPLCRKIDGVGRYAREFVSHYATAFPEHTIILVGFIDDTLALPELLKIPNVRFVKLPIIRKVYSFLYFRFMRIPVDMFLPRFDIFINANFTRFPFITKRPSLVAIHDFAYVRFPETIERKNLANLRKHIPLTLKENRAVITTSRFTKRELEDIFPDHPKVFAADIGIDSANWQPSTKKRQEYILAVGTLEPRKNLGSLLKAYNLLPEATQKAHPLIVVGSSGWGATEAASNPNISYTGYVDDAKLLDLYHKAKLFVFPSIYEGFGLPMLEALSTETPIVCSDIPPFKDIAGSQATYFDPQSVENIAEVLSKTFVKKTLPTAKFDREEHSWNKSMAIYDEAIRYALRKKL